MQYGISPNQKLLFKAIRVTVMPNRAPVRRVPMVFSLDEKRPGLEANHSLSSGATIEVSGSAPLHKK